MPNTVAAQPTQRANALQPDNVFICNTSNIDSMRHGRPQTVKVTDLQIDGLTEKRLPNGAIVTLNETQESQANPELDHVHAVKFEAQQELVGKFIIVSPEINVEQYRRIDNSIANHMLVAEETYTAYELQLRDRIEFSQAYFANLTTDAAAIKALADNHVKLGVDAQGRPDINAADQTLRVISVREQRQPLMMALGGGKMPESYFMIKVEVIK